jgi:ubiquinone/menaquinone biosynthesis C-methylase UbiE
MVKSLGKDYLLAQYGDASNLQARAQLHQRYSTNPYEWQQWVFDQLDLPLSSRILELGCGPGNLWRENLERLPAGWEIVLADNSPGMVREARQALAHQGPADAGRPFAYAVHDAQAIPFTGAIEDGGTFDAVVANHMLYHVPDRARAFSEIRRVLVPGGRLYAATNGWAHMRELRELHERFQPGSGRQIGSVAAPFTLENGAEQLEPWFSQVSIRRQENSLRVTEAGPLVAYVASTQTLSKDALLALAAHVEREIEQHGVIHITKDSGLFTAVRDAPGRPKDDKIGCQLASPPTFQGDSNDTLPL